MFGNNSLEGDERNVAFSGKIPSIGEARIGRKPVQWGRWVGARFKYGP